MPKYTIDSIESKVTLLGILLPVNRDISNICMLAEPKTFLATMSGCSNPHLNSRISATPNEAEAARIDKGPQKLNELLPFIISGANRESRPKKPTTTLRIFEREILFPALNNGVNKMTKNGTVPISTEVMEEETYCCPHGTSVKGIDASSNPISMYINQGVFPLDLTFSTLQIINSVMKPTTARPTPIS